MRTIKFRAWDSDLGLMMPEVDLSQALQHYKWLGRKDLPIMQFTGLLDKNGREVYENDIVLIIEDVVVEVISGHERREPEGRQEIVKWENGAWFIGDEMAWEEAEYCEIIGNIYQNPELIKDVC